MTAETVFNVAQALSTEERGRLITMLNTEADKMLSPKKPVRKRSSFYSEEQIREAIKARYSGYKRNQ